MQNTRAGNIRDNAAAEKDLITRMDATLKQDRTSYLKAQLRLALNDLDDVDLLLRWEQEAQPNFKGAWLAMAESHIAKAAATRLQVQKLVDTYGGPDKVTEVHDK